MSQANMSGPPPGASYRERLDHSDRFAQTPFWEFLYRRQFHNLAKQSFVRDPELQMAGIDRDVLLVSGVQHWIQEKVRWRNQNGRVYDDILLEYQRRDGRPGWAHPGSQLRAHKINYVIAPSGVAYLLDVPALHRAYAERSEEWFGRAQLREKGYQTKRSRDGNLCLVMPPKVLLLAMVSEHFETRFEGFEERDALCWGER